MNASSPSPPPLIVCNNYIKNLVIYEWTCQAIIIATSRFFRYCLVNLLKGDCMEYQINFYIIKIKLRKHNSNHRNILNINPIDAINNDQIDNIHNNDPNNTDNNVISGTIVVDCFPIFVVSWFILFIMVILLTVKLFLLHK